LPQSSSSLLVHCHAGLGRTGVFIALDVALRQLYQNNTVNIKGVVEKLREKRARAVMNPWQYAYINVVVAEKVRCYSSATCLEFLILKFPEFRRCNAVRCLRVSAVIMFDS
uniref:TYR_PHOSPHATASE_2 domain-containing protein n=1 Tax=Heligmosomoides polygyrus TaxID=6339 RepID=A0A183F874_HELPZ